MDDDVDEFPVVQDDIEDIEARELAASSKVLMDIYGKKIKLDTKWYFESPVMMRQDRIGAIGDIPDPNLYGDQNMDYYPGEYKRPPKNKYRPIPYFGGANPLLGLPVE